MLLDMATRAFPVEEGCAVQVLGESVEAVTDAELVAMFES